MSEKYRVIDGFDYKNEPCKLIEYIETEERYSTENELEANSLCKLLNEQEETIQDLKTRNNRQYDLLKKLSDLMYKRDWKSLEKIVEDWEESDRLLQAEFKCCDGDVE